MIQKATPRMKQQGLLSATFCARRRPKTRRIARNRATSTVLIETLCDLNIRSPTRDTIHLRTNRAHTNTINEEATNRAIRNTKFNTGRKFSTTFEAPKPVPERPIHVSQENPYTTYSYNIAGPWPSTIIPPASFPTPRTCPRARKDLGLG